MQQFLQQQKLKTCTGIIKPYKVQTVISQGKANLSLSCAHEIILKQNTNSIFDKMSMACVVLNVELQKFRDDSVNAKFFTLVVIFSPTLLHDTRHRDSRKPRKKLRNQCERMHVESVPT